ncbi:hypothetical protein [Lapillicoccus sp.]|uniref:hypothetical protein n=1 Tax=Lapillicoccus sp. TaxID=1909287 RepID=UPI0032647429
MRQRSVTVVNGNGGTTATMTFAIRTSSPCGFVTYGGGRVGYGGIANGAGRQQGIGTTPTGTYTMTEAFGVNASPGSALPSRRVAAGDFWVGQQLGVLRLLPQRLSGRFRRDLAVVGPERFGASPTTRAVRLRHRRQLQPRARLAGPSPRRGNLPHVRGSGATAGCVAVSSTEMVTMLRLMRPGDTITIVP